MASDDDQVPLKCGASPDGEIGSSRNGTPPRRRFAFTRRRFMGTAGALVLAGCGNTPSRHFNERVTLTVTTPEGVVSGSSVIEFEVDFQDGWLGGLAGHAQLGSCKGEATMVDLGRRGVLLALLNKDPLRKESVKPAGYTFIVHPEIFEQARREGADDPTQTRREAIYWDLLARLKPHGEVPLKNLSLLVRLSDPKDPRTVQRVEPLDLAQAFGPGVSLTKATFAVTDEPVTTGIEKTLPWLLAPHDGSWIIPPSKPDFDRSTVEGDLEYYDFWSNMQ